MKLFLFAIMSTTVACAGASESASVDSNSTAATPYVGSYSIARPVAIWSGTVQEQRRNLTVPFQSYRSVAGLILRADGTYAAQLAPRFFGERILDDSHLTGMRDGLESVGGWQGRRGTYSVSIVGGKTMLRLENPSTNRMSRSEQ
jgi:hypothetical protein